MRNKNEWLCAECSHVLTPRGGLTIVCPICGHKNPPIQFTFADDDFKPIRGEDTLTLIAGGIKHFDFSKLRCRETAAIQRLIQEMPEHRLNLMTRIATILVSDTDGSIKLQKLTDRIYNFVGVADDNKIPR